MPDDITKAMAAVEMWLGNPVSRNLLKFVTAHDKCGDRLSNSIDMYLGEERQVCWKCRMASRIVGRTLNTGSNLFGIREQEIKEGLRDPIWKRGLMNVLNGIARYGVTKPQIVNAPFLVVWDFTHLCNLKCSHCYQDAQKALLDELTTDEAKRLIEELAAAGVVVIAFSGGEPLMRKDFLEIIAHAHQNHMYVAVASNGTLITPDVASKLRNAGAEYVEISIDGKDALHHDAMRGLPGAFERSLKGIKACVDSGMYTCVATTVTQENYDQVAEIYDLGRELGVQRLMCFNFIPTGRGVELIGKDISPCQRDDLLTTILGIDKAGAQPDILSTAPQFARVALQDGESGIPVGHFYSGQEISGKTRMLADFIGGCGAGRLYCSIEPAGDVQPCVFMPIRLGNIRERSFLDIWHDAPELDMLRDRSQLKGSCADCENKLICGGCRARAWAYYGDLNAPDPGCVNNIAYWESLSCNTLKRVFDVGSTKPPGEAIISGIGVR